MADMETSMETNGYPETSCQKLCREAKDQLALSERQQANFIKSLRDATIEALAKGLPRAVADLRYTVDFSQDIDLVLGVFLHEQRMHFTKNIVNELVDACPMMAVESKFVFDWPKATVLRIVVSPVLSAAKAEGSKWNEVNELLMQAHRNLCLRHQGLVDSLETSLNAKDIALTRDLANLPVNDYLDMEVEIPRTYLSMTKGMIAVQNQGILYQPLPHTREKQWIVKMLKVKYWILQMLKSKYPCLSSIEFKVSTSWFKTTPSVALRFESPFGKQH
jgi:hypothetical protein